MGYVLVLEIRLKGPKIGKCRVIGILEIWFGKQILKILNHHKIHFFLKNK